MKIEKIRKKNKMLYVDSGFYDLTCMTRDTLSKTLGVNLSNVQVTRLFTDKLVGDPNGRVVLIKRGKKAEMEQVLI